MPITDFDAAHLLLMLRVPNPTPTPAPAPAPAPAPTPAPAPVASTGAVTAPAGARGKGMNKRTALPNAPAKKVATASAAPAAPAAAAVPADPVDKQVAEKVQEAQEAEEPEKTKFVFEPPPYIEGFDYEQPIPDPTDWAQAERNAGAYPVYHYHSTKDPNTHLVIGKYPAIPETDTYPGSRANQDTNPHLGSILLHRYGPMTKARMQNTLEKWSAIKRHDIEVGGIAARKTHNASLRHTLTVCGRFTNIGGQQWRLSTIEEKIAKEKAYKETQKAAKAKRDQNGALNLNREGEDEEEAAKVEETNAVSSQRKDCQVEEADATATATTTASNETASPPPPPEVEPEHDDILEPAPKRQKRTPAPKRQQRTPAPRRQTRAAALAPTQPQPEPQPQPQPQPEPQRQPQPQPKSTSGWTAINKK